MLFPCHFGILVCSEVLPFYLYAFSKKGPSNNGRPGYRNINLHQKSLSYLQETETRFQTTKRQLNLFLRMCSQNCRQEKALIMFENFEKRTFDIPDSGFGAASINARVGGKAPPCYLYMEIL